MKTLVIMVIALFSYTNNNHTTETILQEQQQYIGTFAGLTDDYYFEFKDVQGKSTVFHEINNDVDVNLFDEDAAGKKYEITWEAFTIEETDDDGEPTGETQQGKRITAMKEII